MYFSKCTNCNECFGKEDMERINGHYYCYNCYTVCDICSKPIASEGEKEFIRCEKCEQK